MAFTSLAMFALLALATVVAAYLALRRLEPAPTAVAPTRVEVTSTVEPSRSESQRDSVLVEEHSAPDADDSELTPLARRGSNHALPAARGEAEFYAEFKALEPSRLATRAAQAIEHPASRAETMAALRALHDTRHARTSELFVAAARASTDDVLPRTLVHWLSRRARSDELARSTLEALAQSSDLRVDARSAAARALIDSVPENDLVRVEAAFAREREPSVFEEATSAIARRRAPSESSEEALR